MVVSGQVLFTQKRCVQELRKIDNKGLYPCHFCKKKEFVYDMVALDDSFSSPLVCSSCSLKVIRKESKTIRKVG